MLQDIAAEIHEARIDDDEPAPSAGELIPRSTIEQVCAYRDRAVALYEEAFAAIEAASEAVAAAEGMVARATPGQEGGGWLYERAPEIEAFANAVKLPARDQYLRVARRLTDVRVWSWIITHTDIERLMDVEEKKKLRDQMRYVPERVDPHSRQVITEEGGRPRLARGHGRQCARHAGTPGR
ncbi:MAG: hypothetical protein KIS96_11540 [Bauldia sp.]|nr:hypothetical protein [Bauldia sp.]